MSRAKKAFISQPMQGLSLDVIESNRIGVANWLKARGYEVIDSIFTEENFSAKNTPLFNLGKSIQLIGAEADVVYFMRGWSKSRDCNLEHQCCQDYGVTVMYEA